MSRRSTT